ncbi:hypothetical protein N8600_08150 [Gammaproteobacteria bacterium]|nr:hypothetical protein [Gammaproteobacteria bacterium]
MTRSSDIKENFNSPSAADDAATAMMESAANRAKERQPSASEKFHSVGVVVQLLGLSIFIITGGVYGLNILFMSENIDKAANVFILFALPAYLISYLIRFLLTGSRKPFPWQ